MRKVAVAAAVLALVSAGCGGSGTGAKGTASPSAVESSTTPPPSETPSPTAAAFTVGATIYADTFVDTSKGWSTTETARAKYEIHPEYATKLMTVTAKTGDTQLFPHPEFRSVPKEKLRDYQVAADLQSTLAFGQKDWLGVTCRDLSNKRYSFQLRTVLETHTVSWRIAKHDGANIDTLASGDTDIGGSAWTVAGTCVTGSDGNATLAMSVNGQEVGRTLDTEAPLTEGYAGVYLLSASGRTTINVLGFAVKAVTTA